MAVPSSSLKPLKLHKDLSRIQKTLFTSEENGPKPTLWEVTNDEVEAECIAYEIRRLMAHSGGLLGYNDFAVLRESWVPSVMPPTNLVMK